MEGHPFPAYLVRGDDSSVTSDAVRALVGELVGDFDPVLVVEEVPAEAELSVVVDAAQTPPFFGDRRVVIAPDIGRFSAQDVAPLVAYLGDPSPTTSLVLIATGGQVARALVDRVRKVGHVVEAGVPTGRARSTWLSQQIKGAAVRLDGPATALVAAHLGEDVGRLRALLEILEAAYGSGARLGVDELGPFLGERGSVAPWELTDAIDRGDTDAALQHLHRLLGAGGRHPLVVLATLHNHLGRILRLEGAGVADEKEAATILGMTGSTFPAKKALVQSRRLGHEAVARAITLLADADLALKGSVEWSPELVLEVLVARLSRLAPRATSGHTRR
jgi:DNA polymerase-3 subunit delta